MDFVRVARGRNEAQRCHCKGADPHPAVPAAHHEESMRRGQGVRKPRRGPGARPATSTGEVFRYTPRPPANRATLGYFLERGSVQTVNCPLPRGGVLEGSRGFRFLVSLTGGVRPVRAQKAMEPKPPVPVSSTSAHCRRI